MKVAVVGAGLIGAGVANTFVENGDSVVVLAPRPNPILNRNVEFVGGRAESGSDVSDLLRGADVLIDAGSSYVPSLVQEAPARAIPAAVTATSWLAEQAVTAGVGCFIFVSSGGAVYGPSRAPHHEHDALAPISAYGAMKAASEYAVAAITRDSATRFVNLRVSNAYGPGQNLSRPQGIIGVAWRNQLLGRPIALFGSERTVRDFIYIDDVGELCGVVARSDFSGAVNAGSGQGLSLGELFTAMAEVTGEIPTVVHHPAREFDLPHSVLDIDLARGLGWAPKVPMRDGLERTWVWIRDNCL